MMRLLRLPCDILHWVVPINGVVSILLRFSLLYESHFINAVVVSQRQPAAARLVLPNVMSGYGVNPSYAIASIRISHLEGRKTCKENFQYVLRNFHCSDGPVENMPRRLVLLVF